MTKNFPLAVVVGGGGFVGSSLVRALVEEGWRVKVAVRFPNGVGDVRTLGLPGQVACVYADVARKETLAGLFTGARLVVNLVGVLFERGKQTFQRVHVEGAAAVAQEVREAGVERLVHMSALGAAMEGVSAYARTKAEGEKAVWEAVPEAVVVRPSVMFGVGDGFLQRFVEMARFMPVFPLVGANTKLQPVYVGDVVQGILKAAATQGGGEYAFGGPAVVRLQDVVRWVMEVVGCKRRVLPVPFGLGRVMGAVLGLAPGAPLLTVDQVRLLESDNVVGEEAEAKGMTLQGLGIEPSRMEALAPWWLVPEGVRWNQELHVSNITQASKAKPNTRR